MYSEQQHACSGAQQAIKENELHIKAGHHISRDEMLQKRKQTLYRYYTQDRDIVDIYHKIGEVLALCGDES